MGRFASVPRREAEAAVVRRGGVVSEDAPDLVVIGEQSTHDEDSRARVAAEASQAELLSEGELWRRLGLVDDNAGVRGLYSPGMLAEAVGLPSATVRRWLRRGLLRPACRVNRLAYFDFEEARVARLLAEALSQGSSIDAIERRADQLQAAYPSWARPLADLPVEVADGGFFVRVGARLTEPTGQLRLDFHREGVADRDADAFDDAVLLPIEPPTPVPGSLRERAWSLAENGDYGRAVELWRLAMLESGPTADDHAQLAEWLHELGEREAARERYYAALEIDADFVEARIGLGCVLQAEGEIDLAIAAFRGAVEQSPDVADARLHLAQALESVDEAAAEEQWRRFVELAPEGPWSEQARSRLAVLVPQDE